MTSSLKLDYEQLTEVVLSISVSDGDPTHVSNCSLDINITDINDNGPVFVDPSQFNVSEDAEIDDMIGTVNVS